MSGESDNGLRLEIQRAEVPRLTTPSVVPRRASVFEPVRDRYGWRLALVFGNHAPDGLCPYVAAGRCFHCDIGSGEGAAFDHVTNRKRLAWFRDHYQSRLASITHLVLYNSGSVLNPREMPPEMFDEILAFARSLPAVRVISLDSREAYIRPAVLRRVLQFLGDSYVIRPILGLETADDRIRNEVLQKAMPRTAITRVFRDLSQVAAELGTGKFGLDVNIVIGGPGTTNETAVDDAVTTARFALICGFEHGIEVDLNLHPYYAGHRGSARFPHHPRCSLATAVRAVSMIADLVRSMAAESYLFIGWQDEGHDLEREEREREIHRTHAPSTGSITRTIQAPLMGWIHRPGIGTGSYSVCELRFKLPLGSRFTGTEKGRLSRVWLLSPTGPTGVVPTVVSPGSIWVRQPFTSRGRQAYRRHRAAKLLLGRVGRSD